MHWLFYERKCWSNEKWKTRIFLQCTFWSKYWLSQVQNLQSIWYKFTNIHFITLNWSAHQSVSKWKLAALLFLEYSFGKHLSCNFRGKQSINQKVNCFDLVKGKLNCHSTMKFSKCAIITCLHNMVSVNNNLNPL